MQMGKLIVIALCLCFHPVFGQYKTGEPQLTSLKNQTFVAKVIRILDGDTMEILYKNKPVKIRLAHIDCPEKRSSQPFNNNAKIALSNLCFGQQVTIYSENTDRYGRIIAVVVNNKKQTVNQEMIKQGMAWHFKKYSKDPIYANLELEARKGKIGLWRDPKPVPPWEWRKPKGNAHNSFTRY